MGKKKKWLCRTISRKWLVWYLVILGTTASWADRTEIVLACIGALLTLSGYGSGSGESSGSSLPSQPDTR